MDIKSPVKVPSKIGVHKIPTAVALFSISFFKVHPVHVEIQMVELAYTGGRRIQYAHSYAIKLTAVAFP